MKQREPSAGIKRHDKRTKNGKTSKGSAFFQACGSRTARRKLKRIDRDLSFTKGARHKAALEEVARMYRRLV